MIVSPIVEACPGTNKAARMSMLHSFYCWGHMAVALLSTLYFTLAGIENWRLLPPLWALVPLFTLFAFTKVPIYAIPGDDEETRLPKSIFRIKVFWILFFVMICAGASEQGVSQWSSMFAEDGLKVSKTVGDLLGPCSFAFFMGIDIRIDGMKGESLNLIRSLKATSLLCILGYLVTSLSPIPLLSLAGCAICGFFRGTDVARYLLPGRHLSERRRHLYVRYVRPGRRRRLLRRPRRSRDHLPVYRKNESGNPYCNPLPCRNADTGISLEATETSLKAGYPTVISSEKKLSKVKRTSVQRPRQAGVQRSFIYISFPITSAFSPRSGCRPDHKSVPFSVPSQVS